MWRVLQWVLRGVVAAKHVSMSAWKRHPFYVSMSAWKRHPFFYKQWWSNQRPQKTNLYIIYFVLVPGTYVRVKKQQTVRFSTSNEVISGGCEKQTCILYTSYSYLVLVKKQQTARFFPSIPNPILPAAAASSSILRGTIVNNMDLRYTQKTVCSPISSTPFGPIYCGAP